MQNLAYHPNPKNTQYSIMHFDFLTIIWILFISLIYIEGYKDRFIWMGIGSSALYLIIVYTPNSPLRRLINRKLANLNNNTVLWALKHPLQLKICYLCLLLLVILIFGIFLHILEVAIIAIAFILLPVYSIISLTNKKN